MSEHYLGGHLQEGVMIEMGVRVKLGCQINCVILYSRNMCVAHLDFRKCKKVVCNFQGDFQENGSECSTDE